MRKPKHGARLGLGLVMLGMLGGCIAAAAAGGAAGAVYVTTRGVEAVVPGTVEEVELRARKVFGKEGISIEEASIKASGDKRELSGKKGDQKVSVEINRESPTTTKTEVIVVKHVVDWDKDYARLILNQIVAPGN